MLTILNPNVKAQRFPDAEKALKEPNGLLAIGGCLSPIRLENAYRHGIFPWYSEGEPILWWSPHPRLVLFPEKLKVSKSLRKAVRRQAFQISFDAAFEAVIEACAKPRPGANGTWITREIKAAYTALHRQGLAHSVEAWQGHRLAGGLYGVAVGRVFYGESMFYRHSNASKVAFVALVEALKDWHYALIDCQVHTRHLVSLGAEEIPRTEFLQLLTLYCDQSASEKAWKSNRW